jgi:hypothetical protein
MTRVFLELYKITIPGYIVLFCLNLVPCKY